MQLPAEIVEQARKHMRERNARATFAVWPDHWHAFQVFQDMAQQWRVAAGMGGVVRLGLDYGALPPVLEANKNSRHRVPLKTLMHQLHLMQNAALPILNARH